MVRHFIIILALALAACGAPVARTPNTPTAPSTFVAATLPPVAPTILPSDRGKPTKVAQTNAASPQATPTATLIPAPTLPPTLQANATAALRPQFAGDLDLIDSPTLYRMNWILNDDLSKLHGTSLVSFTNRTGQMLSEIYFRLFANYPGSPASITIDSVQVDGQPVVPELKAEDTALRVPLASPLAPGAKAQIELAYSLDIPADSQVRYGDFTRTPWITQLPSIYPLIPAFGSAGWHIEIPPAYGDLVFSDSAIYDVTVDAPARFQAIASGQLVQETPHNDRITWRFVGAPMRDFDLNLTSAMVSGTERVDDIVITSWHLPDDTVAALTALGWSAKAVRVFENRFGPYPFKELELVETATTAGGIEYPGVITVATQLYKDAGQRNFFEFATVHETAHQWWYSVVGNDQVNHPWLDEALANYSTLIYFEDAYGKEAGDEIRKNYFENLLEHARGRYGDKPAGLPVDAYEEDAYGAFVYGKGALFFQAVRDQLGDDKFFEALRTYYQRFKYKSAAPEDLVQVFNEVGGQDITPLYNEWILGK